MDDNAALTASAPRAKFLLICLPLVVGLQAGIRVGL
jgi:hypothetical protein